jgi:hypothetical protein
MKNALGELACADEPGFFDYVLVNDELEKSYAQLEQILLASDAIKASDAFKAGATGPSTPDTEQRPPHCADSAPPSAPTPPETPCCTETANPLLVETKVRNAYIYS